MQSQKIENIVKVGLIVSLNIYAGIFKECRVMLYRSYKMQLDLKKKKFFFGLGLIALVSMHG